MQRHKRVIDKNGFIMISPLQNNDFVSTQQAAKLLSVSIRTVQSWVAKGVLPAWKTPGGHCRILRSEIDNRLHEKQQFIDGSDKEKTVNVLVIEDEPVLLELYRFRIEAWKMPLKLNMATDGFEGLILAGKCNPDIIITDLMMPGMDGFQMLKALEQNKDQNNTRIIVVTSLSNEEIETRGSLPDNILVLNKPVPFELLEKEVRVLQRDKTMALAPIT